ncbi:MAG: PAS domain S-box protein [Alphaproteobacteria bacterium]|nr:PAS domain S-box protein [Alphaproteobacteria bacterium]
MQNDELRCIQQELEESRDRYVELYEFAPVGYLTLGRDGRIAAINLTGAGLLRVDRAKLLSARFSSFIAQDDGDRWHRFFLHAIDHAEGLEIDLDLVRGDGTGLPCHLDCRAMARGESPGLRMTLSDMTERKRAEDELHAATEAMRSANAKLRASNQDLEQFAYVAAHDLQEPLRMVVSFGQLLEKKFHDTLDDEVQAYIGFMVEGGHRMQGMVTDLLEFSRIGRAGRAAETFDSRDAIVEALSRLSMAISDSGAKVSAENLPVIIYDRPQFTQLVQNLIGNAVKYRDPLRPPEIAVTARHEGNEWTFAVTDNGIGIDPTYFEQIFGIFRRLHTRDKYDGSGIGLAICKKIIERHGGHIWLDSAPNVGSTFYFSVPDP